MIRAMELDTEPVSRKLPGSLPLAWILALAYLLIIIYASLQPFHDWRFPPDEVLHFLTAPWPRYITLEDVLVNLIAYVPLGFLLSLALKSRLHASAGVALAVLLSAALSLSMESIQMFLPDRIASNVDVLTNSVGALLGGMAAPLLSPTGFPGRRLAALRQRWFVPGTMAETGLLMICLWLITQLHPTAQLFGTGYLRGTFDLPALFSHTPQLLLLSEALVVLLNLVGLGLLISALIREALQQYTFIATVVAAGIAIKSVTLLALFKTGATAWLTPGVTLGLFAGAVLLGFLVQLPRSARVSLATLCLCAAVAVINLAPDNPYQTIPSQLLMGGPSHFLSFSGIVRALSELWPFLTIPYLTAAALGPFAQVSS